MEKNAMKKIYSKLGLAETATEDDACVAIDNLQQGLATAKNQSQSPDLAKFVPRADYDQTCARAINAEQKLKDVNDSHLTNEIDTEITAALTAGKITPATKDYHVAQCRQEGGLARFKDFVKAAPAVAVDDGKAAGDPAATGKALNAEELQVASMFGNSAEDLKKYGA